MSILVQQDEYERLLKLQKEHRKYREQQQQQQQQQQHKQSHIPAKKLASVAQEAVDRDNEERREILAPFPNSMLESASAPPSYKGTDEVGRRKEHSLAPPPHQHPHPAEEDTTPEEEEEGESSLNDLSLPFLPATQWVKARRFLHGLVRLPGIHLRQGCLFLHKKKLGHVAFLLHHLFGNDKVATVQHMPLLLDHLKNTGLIALLPRRPLTTQRKKTKKVQNKKKAVKQESDKMRPISAQVYNLLK